MVRTVFIMQTEINLVFQKERKNKIMDIITEPMESKYKVTIDEAYHACMNGTATEEQELIWR